MVAPLALGLVRLLAESLLLGGCATRIQVAAQIEVMAAQARVPVPQKALLRRLLSEDQEFFLFLDLARMAAAAFTIGGNDGWLVALVRAGPCIGIAGLDIDKRLLTQLG